MPLVMLGASHRADRETEEALSRFSSFTTLIDVQPDLDLEGSDMGSQCSTCSLVDFLSAVPNLNRHLGLAPFLATMQRLPELQQARATGDVEAILSWSRSTLGSGRVYEIVESGSPRVLGRLPAIWCLGGSDLPRVALGDVCLLRPDADGPSAISERLRAAQARGARRFLLGHLRHARSAVEFSACWERENIDGEWQSMLVDASTGGADTLGCVIPLPACALLQLTANQHLESMRSRLDLQLRRLDEDASMMCPENVSGYGMLNELKRHGSRLAASKRGLGLRYGNILIMGLS